MTKPAGCFLQLLSIGFLFGGVMKISDGNPASGILAIAVALVLLVIGGRPARRKS